MLALEKIQNAFDGEAERLGLEKEEDVNVDKPEIINATAFLEKYC